MRKPFLVTAIIVVLALSLAGCSKSSPKESSADGVSGGLPGRPGPNGPAATVTATKSVPDGVTSSSDSSLGQLFSGNRMIVRNATLNLEVDDVLANVERVNQIAAQAGGFVVSSKTFGEGKKLSGAVTIRVPADRFDSTMKSLRALAFRIVNEDISTRDVSEEFVDLQSRLRNLQATEQQLLKLMQQATKVDEALSVQRELTKVQADIEQTRGRMQFLEQSSATSLINVNLQGSGLSPNFAALATEVEAGEEITFRDSSSGGTPPYVYSWSFGDGESSELKNPAHTYKKAGTYAVSLKIVDDKGLTATETKKSYITVVKPDQWSLSETFLGAANAFVTVAKALATLAIYLLFLSPIWGGILILVVFLSRRARKPRP